MTEKTNFDFIALDLTDAFVISDIHLGVRNNSLSWQENIKDYFDSFFIPLIKKNKTKDSFVLILGDVFDDRKSISIDTLNLTIDILDKVSEVLPVYIIIGNHDMFKRYDNNINSLKVFERHKYVHVIKTPTVICSAIDLEHDLMNYALLLPHQGDVQKESKIIQDFLDDYGSSDKESPNLIFTHTDIAGLKYDNNKNINTGVVLKKNANVKIYSGHIHKRQETSKVTYVGSPYHLRRSDIGNDKGVYRINFLKPKDKPKFFKNNYSPIFQRCFYDAIIDLTIKDLKKILKNNYTDIIINESDLRTLNVNDLFVSLNSCEAKRIEIIVNKNLETSLENNDENYQEISLNELIENNIDNMNISPGTKKKIKDLFNYYNTLANQEFDEE